MTHLSKAQLARKRANDREAQRNIRQRTKEHIENLERKVKELEQVQRSSSMERVLKRNKELEDEVKKLRAQVSAHQTSAQIPPEIPQELLIPQKASLEWMPESPAEWPTSNVSQIPPLEADVEIPVSNPTYPAPAAPLYAPTSTTVSLAYEDEASQPLYAGAGWDAQLNFGPQTSSSAVTKPIPAWAPFHDSFSQPSHFSNLQTSGFNDLINDRSSYNIALTWTTSC